MGKPGPLRRPLWIFAGLHGQLIWYQGEEFLARLRRLVLERLMRYYRFLSEMMAKEPARAVTSARISEALDIGPSQVRKDFGAIGLLGAGRVGYNVCEACRALRVVLGFDQQYEAVLVGAGHLGGALLAYSGFARYGLHIVAAFDSDQRRIGSQIAGCTIRSTMLMKSYVEANKIRLAISGTDRSSGLCRGEGDLELHARPADGCLGRLRPRGAYFHGAV